MLALATLSPGVASGQDAPGAEVGGPAAPGQQGPGPEAPPEDEPLPLEGDPGDLSGVIYWDENQDGVRDADEPGLDGIVVRYGQGSAVTVTSGGGEYELEGLEAGQPLHIQTGWLRTQCNNLFCEAGPGPDNAIGVSNQRVKIDDVDDILSDEGGAVANVGLVPAWDGDYPIPADYEPEEQDAAIRFTRVGGCEEGTREEALCEVGGVVQAQLEVHNQGTEPIDEVDFSLRVPAGTSIRTPPTVAGDGYNLDGLDAEEIRVDDDSGTVQYRLTGELPPAGLAFMWVALNVDEGPETRTPLPIQDPYDRQSQARILAISPGPDADSELCVGSGPSTCTQLTGGHSKLGDNDDSGLMGFNVSDPDGAADDAEVTTFDLALSADFQGSSVVAPGAELEVRLTVDNEGIGAADVSNVELVLSASDGVEFDPDDNPGWVLDGSQMTTRVPGPLEAGRSVRVPIRLRLADDYPEATCTTDTDVTMSAEIAGFDDADSGADGVNLTIADQNAALGGDQPDRDSTPDSNLSNDTNGEAIEDDRSDIGLEARADCGSDEMGTARMAGIGAAGALAVVVLGATAAFIRREIKRRY